MLATGATVLWQFPSALSHPRTHTSLCVTCSAVKSDMAAESDSTGDSRGAGNQRPIPATVQRAPHSSRSTDGGRAPAVPQRRLRQWPAGCAAQQQDLGREREEMP